jgi:hypothetical protein
MNIEKANPDSRTVRIDSQKAIEFEVEAARWLHEGNLATESGEHARAERMYTRSQYWHDKMNAALGNGTGV